MTITAIHERISIGLMKKGLLLPQLGDLPSGCKALPDDIGRYWSSIEMRCLRAITSTNSGWEVDDEEFLGVGHNQFFRPG